jgi:hypothetical protein
MRPGYLNGLDYWFGESEESKQQGKTAELMASRLVATSGSANFQPVHYIRFGKKVPPMKDFFKEYKVRGPRDLLTYPWAIPKKESVVDEYYQPGEDTSTADAPFRSTPW